MEQLPTITHIHAVLVTYRPDPAVTDRLEATHKQVEKLIIIDNASDAATVERLQTYAAQHEKTVDLILNEHNKGLAAAQNQGIRYALEHGADWILLLDDDSTPAEAMVQILLDFLPRRGDGGPQGKPTALLAPHIIQPDSPHPTRYVVPRGKLGFRRVHFSGRHSERGAAESKNLPPDQVRSFDSVQARFTQDDNEQNTLYPTTVIASGSLIHADVLREIGLMREDFFIDYIDTEFCLRLRKHGYPIIVVRDAELTHHIGAKQAHALGVVTSNHSAKRRYTIFRNRFIVWKQYHRSSPHYVLYDAMAACYDLFRILAFEQQKRSKLGAALRGLWHGVRGKMDFVPYILLKNE